MTKNKYLLGIFASLTLSANAQKEKVADASTGNYKVFATDQTELGIHAGVTGLHGDVGRDLASTLGFGVGFHVRKALDYTWSLRLDAGYEQLNGGSGAGSTDPKQTTIAGQPSILASDAINGVVTTQLRGTMQLVASLNNNRWENGLRRINPYFYLGGGLGNINTTIKYKTGGDKKLTLAKDEVVNPLVEFGGGISYRISDKMNIGVDAKLTSVFGKRADLLDAYDYRWRDLATYLSARLNFNLGGGDAKTAKSLPLWWVNPAAKINADVAEIAARPKLDLTDTDGDGIIDMLDQEKDTPAGARVDTRGVSLDSDGDGIADYKDKEPFSPVGYPIDKSTGVAQVTKPNYITQTEVDKIVADKLKAWEAIRPANNAVETAAPRGGASVADWFLPMIHFDFASPAIRQSEIGNLYNVATVMKNNPGIKVVVSGYADKVSDEASNQALSYRRAQNSIDYLVKKFGIDRSRLVLNYAGENAVLVDTKSQNLMNRRVEFKVAQSESEMSAPAGASKKYKGSKNAGY
jgi:OmpA-OmpF porin, OOP family